MKNKPRNDLQEEILPKDYTYWQELEWNKMKLKKKNVWKELWNRLEKGSIETHKNNRTSNI